MTKPTSPPKAPSGGLLPPTRRLVIHPVRPRTQEEILLEIVPEITSRIVAIARPLRIVLFGSAARGEMGPDSDLDILVIMPNGSNRRRTCEAIYMGLYGLGVPKDIVVVTEDTLARHGSDPWMIYGQALSEGKELYRAQA